MVAPQKMPEHDQQIADAADGNWVDRWAPRVSRPYLRLSRADRPIGTWLLLLPCWWGALIGAAMTGGYSWHVAWVMFGCGIGAWFMRGAGCTWNDFTDREIDAQVARTRQRPIPSGQVSPFAAVVWMCAQALVGLLILLSFNQMAIFLGFASLLLVGIYPFAKRFTWWPQMFLGLAFNWGALLAYAAVTGSLGAPAILLYVSGIAWTLFYDTIYAHQDKEDDALAGVKSTARLFGAQTHRWLTWFLVITVCAMGWAIIATFGATGTILAYVIALGGPWAMGWHLAWQNRNLDIDNPANCLGIFRSNRNAGLLPVLFLAAALLV